MIPMILLNIQNDADRAFMVQLYEDYKGLMYKTALRIAGNRSDIDDMISESMVALIRNIHSIQSYEKPALMRYIESVVRSRVYNHLRNEGRKAKYTFLDDGTTLGSVPSQGDSVERIIEKSEEIERLKIAIQQLSEADQEILDMKYHRDLKNDEIAEELGITKESARKRITRARIRAHDSIKAVSEHE